MQCSRAPRSRSTSGTPNPLARQAVSDDGVCRGWSLRSSSSEGTFRGGWGLPAENVVIHEHPLAPGRRFFLGGRDLLGDFPGAEFQVSDQPELREAVSQGWPVGEESRCQNQNCCESHFGRKQPAMDDSANVSSSHTFPRTHRLTTKLADSLPARETHTTSRNHARLDGFRLAGLRRARFSQLRTVSDPQLPVSG